MPNRPNLINIIDPDQAPLTTGKVRKPDRREVSLRWLSGTILTGVASTALMGAALLTALDGKQLLATPPEIASFVDLSDTGSGDTKTSRLITTANLSLGTQVPDRRRMSVSTVTQVGDANVIRTKPFEHLTISLARVQADDASYPPFNPLSIFAEGNVPPVPDSGVTGALIYGANVETEAAVKVVDFEFNTDVDLTEFTISADEAEEILRVNAALLAGGETKVASVTYVDPLRFGTNDPALGALITPQVARVVPQNVSVAPSGTNTIGTTYKEDLVEARSDVTITEAFSTVDYDGLNQMGGAIATLLNSEQLSGGQSVRLGLERERDQERWSVKRASVYRGGEHLLTIALKDDGQYVPAQEPVDRGVMTNFGPANEEPALPAINPATLPTAYDAIHRAVASNDLPTSIADRIVKMVAADVDFRARIRPEDGLELFYSLPEDGEPDQASERDLLFVSATFNGQTNRFYKFRKSDGKVGYYDEEGRSARQFLLRNPVPSGKFRSGFGMRRHPILGYSKMHWGVDWSAPHGTPIISPGNGTVQKAGWAGGYGRQTIISHANGYETSYSHQTRFAKGVQPGAQVKQGQVIGYIGTTGLSTGPHLHYEMRVNGKRVDPLRVRLPDSDTLTGDELLAFTTERDRIDALLASEPENETLAAL
ncbi:MAG: M23 family metallopeptidase [Pseudomonadota bacterium]